MTRGQAARLKGRMWLVAAFVIFLVSDPIQWVPVLALIFCAGIYYWEAHRHPNRNARY